jgi:hypothetical protein
MNTEEKLFFIGAVLVPVFLVIYLVFGSIFGIHYETGRGNHSGYITAVQKQGLIFKTWRAYVKTDLSSSQEDTYCVDNEETAKKLESMAENKEKGTFQYKKYLFAGMTLCEGEGDIVYGVK